MGIWGTVLEVGIALLAVIGGYGMLRGLVEAGLCPRELRVAILLLEADDVPNVETLDILLGEAARHPARRRGQGTLLLLTPSQLADITGLNGRLLSPYAELLTRYAAEIRIVATLPLPDRDI